MVSQSSSMSEPQTLVRDTVSKTKVCFSQDKVSLCGPGWSQTHRDPPGLAFQVLGLQGCAIMAEEWQWDREDGVHLRTLVRKQREDRNWDQARKPQGQPPVTHFLQQGSNPLKQRFSNCGSQPLSQGSPKASAYHIYIHHNS